MKPSRIVKICGIVVSASVICICSMNFASSDDQEIIQNLNTEVTQDYHKTYVSSKVQALNNSNTTSQDPGLPGPNQNFANEFLMWLDRAHKHFGSNGLVYDYGGEATIPDLKTNGSTAVEIRMDCSGYVSYALYLWGKLADPKGLSSRSDWSCGDTFTELGYGNSLESLVPGDIVSWPGHHVQVYAGQDERGHIWYNWGHHESAEDLYAGVSDPSTVTSTTVGYGSSRTIEGAIVYRLN